MVSNGRGGGCLRDHFGLGDIQTQAGRDLLEERYRSLRRQVPVIYLVLLVSLFGLQVSTTGRLEIGLNPPTAVLAIAALRVGLWWGRREDSVTHAQMNRRLTQALVLTSSLCVGLFLWCLFLFNAHPAEASSVFLFASLIAIGAAHGLSSVPGLASIPLIVLALPVSLVAFFSNEPKSMGAAAALSVVALLVLRQLRTHNRQFTDLVRSRSAFLRERENAESARLEALHAAATDFLTGLPNRRAFIEALEAQAAGSGEPYAIAIVDVDRFKPINDTLGHAAGDELLRIIGSRLRESSGERATVARLGGDEFAILLPGASAPAVVTDWGEQLLQHLNRPALVRDRQLNVSASCGMAIFQPFSAETVRAILSRADTALYHAKSDPSRKLAMFDASMEAPHLRRAQIERALRQCDPCTDITIVLQPIVDLHNGRILAHEALARWRDPDLGEIPPSEFVPIAEQLNLIQGLNEELLNRSLREVRNWPDGIRLSFNLSAIQLASGDTAEKVLAALQTAKVAPDRLQVEVTETALLADFATARSNLSRLRSEGVLVVLDDFGAGYSSISYLREIEFDQIKLDGSLVTTAQQCQERLRLLGAVVGLCRALRLEPVAEHIETPEQLRILTTLGCRLGQGFGLHVPVEPEAVHGLTALPTVEGPNRSHLSAA